MELIDSIRSILDTFDADRDIVIDYAAEYAEECAALNERLRRIVDLLRKGNRSDAILLAETEPDVLTHFSSLDFPERVEWVAFLTEFQLQPPPNLLEEEAAEVDEAVNENGALEPLLRKHRILALRKGSLDQRITILRQMLGVSGQNPLWQKDLEAYEKERIKEIASIATKATRQNDASMLRKLLHELSAGWINPVPGQLFESVNRSLQNHLANAGRRNLEKINTRLNECLAELDVFGARQLVPKWQQVAQGANVRQGDPLFDAVAEVFSWLDEEAVLEEEENRFNETLRRLESLIDGNANYAEIEPVFYMAERFEREIPVVLRNRFSDCRVNHEISRKRRFATFLSIVSISIILLGVGVYFFFDSINYSSRKTTAVEQLTLSNSQKNWEASVKIFENLDPRLKKEPELLNLGQVAQQAFDDQEARKQNFAALFEQLEASPKDPPPTALVNQLENLVNTEQESNLLENAKLRILAHQQQLLAQRNAQAQEKMAAWLEELKKLETDSLSPNRLENFNNLLGKLKTAGRAYAGNYHQMPTISSTILKQLKALTQRCEKSFSFTEGNMRYLSSVANFKKEISSSSSAEEYVGLLKSFSEKYPDSVEATNLGDPNPVHKMAKSWNRWVDYLARPEWKNLRGIKKADAMSLVSEFETLTTDERKSEPGPELTKVITFLKNRANENRDLDTTFSDLKTFLDSYAMSQLWVIVKQQSETVSKYYFVAPDPKVINGEATDQIYYTDVPFDGDDDTVQKSETFRKIIQVFPAPHNRLSDKLSKVLVIPANVRQADETIFKLIQTWLDATNPKLGEDPGTPKPDLILQGFILEKVLALSLQAKLESAIYLNPNRQELADFDLGSVNWVKDPTAKELTSLRNRIGKILDEFRKNWNPAEIQKQIDKKYGNLLPPERKRMVWMGVVFKSANDTLELVTSQNISGDHQLFSFAESDAKYIPVPVGSWNHSEKKASLDPGRAKVGQLVFSIPAPE